MEQEITASFVSHRILSAITLFMTAQEMRGNSRRVTLPILGATAVAISSQVSSGVWARGNGNVTKRSLDILIF